MINLRIALRLVYNLPHESYAPHYSGRSHQETAMRQSGRTSPADPDGYERAVIGQGCAAFVWYIGRVLRWLRRSGNARRPGDGGAVGYLDTGPGQLAVNPSPEYHILNRVFAPALGYIRDELSAPDHGWSENDLATGRGEYDQTALHRASSELHLEVAFDPSITGAGDTNAVGVCCNQHSPAPHQATFLEGVLDVFRICVVNLDSEVITNLVDNCLERGVVVDFPRHEISPLG